MAERGAGKLSCIDLGQQSVLHRREIVRIV